MQSNTKIYLILIIILGFVGYNLLVMHDIKTDVAKFDSKIDSIQITIDSISIANNKLDSQIESLHSEIKTIDGNINRVEDNISNIKIQTDEKINNVDTFTFDELVSFFTNRYNDVINNDTTTSGKTKSSDSKGSN